MIIKRDKEDILKEFKEEYLECHWVRDFIEIDEVYRNKKSEIDKELMETFERLCDKCISLQNSNLKGNINAVDGVISYGEVNGVRVGVIRTNGQISTVFPDATIQP